MLEKLKSYTLNTAFLPSKSCAGDLPVRTEKQQEQLVTEYVTILINPLALQ